MADEQSGESGQAQTYFSRASLLVNPSTPKQSQLEFRLCQVSCQVPDQLATADQQARLFDFSARFNEAAQRYHELSFVADIDEEERVQML